MKLSLWHLILSLRDDIGRILERTLIANAPGVSEGTLLQYIDPSSLTQLRSELRNRLDVLKDALHKELTESETYLVMFPSVLLCDEMVMSRVPKQQHTEWRLLQHELFQINYGGDVFYDFVDERVAKPDTPGLVFEVLYFCLSAGFVGKFGHDGAKVQRYKALLAQRIPGAQPAEQRKRRRRPPAEASSPETSASGPPAGLARALGSIWYYAAALGVLALAVAGVILFSNL